MEEFKLIIDAIGSFLWNNYTLYAVVATGIVFTIWSGFSQYYALPHGFKVIKGDYDKDDALCSEKDIYVFPLKGTITYLSDIGGPTAIFKDKDNSE